MEVTIYHLNNDCFDSIFEWLELRDLLSLAQTCSVLRSAAGTFFQSKYKTFNARGENDGLHINSAKVNVFSAYIQKVSISGARLGAYQYVARNCQAIKQIRLHGTVPVDGFACIRTLMQNVQILDMNDCMIQHDFYEDYLKHFPNLKSLSVARSGHYRNKHTIIGHSNGWLLHEYPSLKHFELTELHELTVNELTQFFQRNRNVRTFTTDARSLWENRQCFLECGVTLDKLAIDVCQTKMIDSNNELVATETTFYDLLVQLKICGFYKQLELHVAFVYQRTIDKLMSLNGLDVLAGDILRIDQPLRDLRTLVIWCGDEMQHVDQIPTHLDNLERIYFTKIKLEHIVPFIVHLPKLRVMKIQRSDAIDFASVDLKALNEARAKLKDAHKLEIFVRDDNYLAARKRRSCCFRFITLKRYESYEWHDLSAKSRYFKEF